MESTSTYWVPVWDILLEMGFELMLVNPYLIKQMPGRKSDVKDAQWIACLLYKGMLRGSMIPSAVIQQLRTYSRKYTKLQEQKIRSLQKMDRIMVMCGFRISSCMSSLGTKSVINIVTALIKGESRPDELSSLVYGNTANRKSGKLRESLTGNLKNITVSSWNGKSRNMTFLKNRQNSVFYKCDGYAQNIIKKKWN